MLETLSLGGGIVYLKDVYSAGSYVDLGYCTDFNLQVTIEQSFKEEYFSDASGNIIKVPSVVGSVDSVLTEGTFTCESLSRKVLQVIWFGGADTSAGTELLGSSTITPIVRGLKFLAVPLTGPTHCVTLPAVQLVTKSPVSLIQYDWKTVAFAFTIVYADNIRTVPTLRVQEEGETLTNFCV